MLLNAHIYSPEHLFAAGNTCFVNVALQCLRYTPQLATSIIPDLMTLSPLPEEGSFSDSNLALPRISLQQSPVKHNGQQEVHQADSHQHFSTAAQEQSKDASRDPSELQLMNGESGAHREPGASLLRIPEVASVTAPSQQYDEGKPHSSQGLSQSTQAFQADALDSAQLALQQQPGSTQIQGSGPHDQQQQQHQQAHPTAANAHGPAAAQADGTTAEQQSPVLPVCVPLKKGEIADSFRALVREVCKSDMTVSILEAAIL